MGRFDYVKYDEKSVSQQAELKEAFQTVEAFVDVLPECRAKSLVFTKLEEAYMWCGKAIRDGQVIRNGSAPLQEERASS